MATKTVHNLRGLDYKFDNTRRGSKYEWFDTLLNEYKRGNAGDFFEIADKFVKGYDTHKDGNGKYNEGSDIPEINASVKSSTATLVNMKLADTFDESVKVYFQNTHSTCFIYTIIIDDMTHIYMMNAIEFKEFIYKFASLNERGFIRFKATSGKTVAFLESLA